jgi:hypothetical protein
MQSINLKQKESKCLKQTKLNADEDIDVNTDLCNVHFIY